jgi:hypothetical protein
MDSLDNLTQFLISAFNIITHWSDYQDDLRQAGPHRRIIMALLLFTIFLCVSTCCVIFFADKIANSNGSGMPAL